MKNGRIRLTAHHARRRFHGLWNRSRAHLGDDRGSNGAELIDNVFAFPGFRLILLHVEFRLPILPRAFFQDVR